MFFIRRTEGQTDTRSTQNCSSEPHKTSQNVIKVNFCFGTPLLKMILNESQLFVF